MGLDSYAYVRAGAISDEQREFNHFGESSRELAYWRKHPNLHGWMEQLWRSRNTDPTADPAFNGVEVELTWEDIDALEAAIRHKQLPATSGFFFGTDSDDEYLQSDLEFVRKARAELFLGLKVFYNSSW